MDLHRVRIRFAKAGDLRLISHRDLVRAVERLFCRAGVGLALSEGFHPKPRLRFVSALALGVTGLDEVFEADLAEPHEPRRLLATLAAAAPPGLTFHHLEPAPVGARKAQARALRYRLPLAAAERQALVEPVARFLASGTWPSPRRTGDAPVDLRPLVEELVLEEQALRMRLLVIHTAGARPRDLLAALGWEDVDGAEQRLIREHVELEPDSGAVPAAFPHCRKESENYEARDADQRRPAGRVPDRDS
jgi:radical SAM-linked protein